MALKVRGVVGNKRGLVKVQVWWVCVLRGGLF
jgi:hypothetical protein